MKAALQSSLCVLQSREPMAAVTMARFRDVQAQIERISSLREGADGRTTACWQVCACLDSRTDAWDAWKAATRG